MSRTYSRGLLLLLLSSSALLTACSEGSTVSPTPTTTPQITLTHFMAFGDSITWGTSRDAATVFGFTEPAPSTSYPSQLATLLAARYTDQTISMVNEGWPGEAIGTGLSRLPSALVEAGSPQVMLLLDGANDLLGSPTTATADYIVDELRLMIRAGKSQIPKLTVLLANFPPQYHPTASELCAGNYDRGGGAEIVPYLNEQIAALAASEGATLVDVYAPMNAAVKTNIGCDGLHPTVAGFALMAQTFNAVLQQKFETTGSAAVSFKNTSH
jgi:lysophospholipase L1-like esterase